MTDKQKEQVKLVNTEAEKKRTQVRDNARKMGEIANQQAAMQAAAIAQANGGTPAQAQNAQNGRGGRGNNNRNSAGAQIERQALTEFQAQVETALLKVLDPRQRTRIKQIALQAEGVGAFNNPEVIQKLAMTQEQVMAIQGVRNEQRQGQRQIMGQLFSGMNNNNNNNGGGGGGRRGRPDPAMFQTPEFQAKIKTVRESQEKLDDQTMANVGRALTKAQRAKFTIMTGDKFDIAKLRRGFMDRFAPAGGTPGTPPTETASTATPTATPAPATPAPATPAPPAASTARRSLREARSAGNP